jgi:hypothetical protein
MKTDETGLHAEDCDCAKCEIGLRPTPLERAAARRALVEAKLAAAARAAAAKPQSTMRLSRMIRPVTRVPPPMSPAELEEMRRDIEALKGTKK